MVYFIRDCENGRVKIGVADRPEHRLRQLQVGASSRLELLGYTPGSFQLETVLHRKFARFRIRGREWFEGDSRLLEEVAYLTSDEPWEGQGFGPSPKVFDFFGVMV